MLLHKKSTSYRGKSLHLKYRSDIDGLRGIAVLLVVLFHCGIEQFSGGYIGVDIFFVISGYLITGIVLGEIDNDRFSISKFYLRRIKRLLPAYFAMLLVVSSFAFVLFTPEDLSNYALSAISSTLYFSNVYFWRTTDYFSLSAEFQPLLHTWSLSIEEQFYVLTPIFALMVTRLRRSSLVVLLSFALFSSLVTCYLVFSRSELASFYLLHTRAWELLFGAVIAVLPRVKFGHGIIVESIRGLALLAILIPAVTLQKGGISPSVYAFFPCLGTSVIIYLGFSNKSLVSGLLGSAILVGLGLISYSLYLWHWPVLALWRYVLGTVELDAISILACISVSVFVSWLSWKWVENPFRRGKIGSANPKTLFIAATAASLVAILPLSASWLNDGFPERFSAETSVFVQASALGNPRRDECFGRSIAESLCTFGASTKAPTVLIWGDSHADAAFPGFGVAAKKSGVAGVFAGSTGCPPLPHVQARRGCEEYNDEVLKYIASNPSIESVVLIARWPLRNEPESLKGEVNLPGLLRSSHYQVSADTAVRGNGLNKGYIEASLDDLIGDLSIKNIDVHVIYGLPEYKFDVPRRLFMEKRLGFQVPSPLIKSDVDLIFEEIEGVMGDLADRHPSIRLYNLSSMICAYECEIERDGFSLYRDGNHLSEFGSVSLLGPVFEDIFVRQQ